MTLSIIVPVFNMVSGGKLANCLDSLLAQEVDCFEIIAVDDKSTDESLTLLREYETRFPDKIKVIASLVNQKQGGAKNLGLSVATGEWIGFIDSDDWIAPDMYAKLLAKAKETGADVVGCDYLLTDEIGKTTGQVVTINTKEQTGAKTLERQKAIVMMPGSMVVRIYKRQIFEENQIRFPKDMFYEDNAIGAFPLLYSQRFELVEEPLYFYYQYQGSTVHTISIERCRHRMEAGRIFLLESKDRGFYEELKQEIDYKVFELGYRNTLFSYIQSTSWPKVSFLRELRAYLKELVPEYSKNPYYEDQMDSENKKLIGMHLKNVFWFLCYYKLLTTYRRLRYGKR